MEVLKEIFKILREMWLVWAGVGLKVAVPKLMLNFELCHCQNLFKALRWTATEALLVIHY